MKPCVCLTSVLVAISAVADNAADAYQEQILKGPLHAYELQVAERTPVPDGTVGEDEYSVAIDGGMFKLTGEDRLRNFLDRRPNKVFYAWDATNLYIAVVSPAKGPLVSNATARDQDVWADDCVELCVTTAKTKLEKRYQVAVNAKGIVYDRCSRDVAWNAEGFRSASAVKDGFWTLEAALPWKAVGLVPADGLKVLANVSRTSVEKEGPRFMSLSRGGYCTPDTMPIVTLKRKAPRYVIGPIGDPSVGKFNVPFKVVSDRTELFTLATAAVGVGPVRSDLHQRHEAKEGEVFTFDSRGQSPETGVFYFIFRDKDFKTIAQVGASYIDEKPFNFLALSASKDGETMIVISQNNVSAPGARMTFEFRDWTTDSVKAYATEVPVPPGIGRTELPVGVKALADGYYNVHYTFVDATGKTIAEDREYFMKESGRGPWAGCTAGSEDTVPSPWTIPAFGTAGFSCWGREIRFGGEGFVSSIVAGGREILSRPIAVRLNGHPVRFAAKLREAHVSYADYELVSDETPVRLAIRAEFDGFMNVALTYAGKVDSLDVEFPLKRAGVVGFDDGATLKKVALPAGTTGHWDRNPEKSPCYWIGDPTSGLMLGADSLKGRHFKDKKHGLALDVSEREAVVTFKIVDTPFTAERRTVSFYLNPTPTRPRNRELAQVPENKIHMWTGHPWRFFETKVPGEGFLRPDLIKPFLDLVRRDHRVFWYFASHGMSAVAPQWSRFDAEWTQTKPEHGVEERKSTTREGRDRGRWTEGCLNGQNFFDYKIWTIDWFVNHSPYTNEVKDLYFDLTCPYACKNKTHDCTWTDEFGYIMHDWTSVACREFQKRVRRILLKKNPQGAMLGHVNSWRTPGDIFFDRYAMGEVFTSYVLERGAYYDVLTPEVMQIGYAARSPEGIVSLLPQIYRSILVYAPHKLKTYDPKDPETRRAIRHFMGYMLTHDLIPCNAHASDGEEMLTLPEEVARLGANRTFSAYYHADCPVTVDKPHPRLLYSLYRGENGKAFLTVLNDTDETREVKISIRGRAGEIPLKLGPREATFMPFQN